MKFKNTEPKYKQYIIKCQYCGKKYFHIQEYGTPDLIITQCPHCKEINESEPNKDIYHYDKNENPKKIFKAKNKKETHYFDNEMDFVEFLRNHLGEYEAILPKNYYKNYKRGKK